MVGRRLSRDGNELYPLDWHEGCFVTSQAKVNAQKRRGMEGVATMAIKAMKLGLATAAMLALAGVSGRAEAAISLGSIGGNPGGNACPNGPLAGCSYAGSPAIIKFDFNDAGGVSLVTLNALFSTIDGSEFSFSGVTAGSGTWTYTPGVGDPLITHYAAKGGPGNSVFGNDGDPNSDTWFTPANRAGQRPALSNMVFFDTAAPPPPPPPPIPEPATLALLGMGLLGLGLARRRRR